MGNVENAYKGISDEKFIQYEEEILLYSGVELSKIERNNIIINEFTGDYIRTYQIGNRENQKFVLIHGYGGSSVFFYKIMQPLSEQFHLIMIDVIGMGGSSRPKFEAKTADEADQFFIETLESWRLAMGGITDFILAGHSFGGYISGHYACKFPQHIKKLLMLSPAGMLAKPPDYDEQLKQNKNEKNKSQRQKLVEHAWENGWSPFGIMRKSGRLIGKSLINKYAEARMKMLPEHELESVKNYMQQIFMKDGSTEYALYLCFEMGMYAKNHLLSENRLGNPELDFPISFFYGDRDWMWDEGGNQIVKINKFKGMSEVYIISDSDHHLYFDNPDEFQQQIIFDIQKDG